MHNKQKNILVWILIGSGLVLLVLYSPIGSPEIYTSQNCYVVIPCVTFESKKIRNTRNAEIISDYTKNESDIFDIGSNRLKPTNYFAGNFLSSNSTSSGSSYPVQSQLFKNSNFFRPHDNSSDDIRTFIISGRSHTNSSGSGSVIATGITTLSLSTRLNSSEDPSNSNGGDPGGNPTSPPIPIGDGFGILIFYGAYYAAYKIHHSVSRGGKFSHRH